MHHKIEINWHLRAWARDKAHKRRYEAVWETEPSTYSMVWMPWWMKISPIGSLSWAPCPPPWAGGWAVLLCSGSSPSAPPFSVVVICWWPAPNCACRLRLRIMISGFASSIHGTQISAQKTSSFWKPPWPAYMYGVSHLFSYGVFLLSIMLMKVMRMEGAHRVLWVISFSVI